MEEIKVKVCVCTACVMQGAMDLVESVESLKRLKNKLDYEANVVVEMDKRIGSQKHGELSPVVSVNGQIIENADSETVMEKIIEFAKKDVKQN